MRVLVAFTDRTVVPWLRQSIPFDGHTDWDDIAISDLERDRPGPNEHTVILVQVHALDDRALRVVSDIRGDGNGQALVVLSSSGTESEILAAIDAGADDCFVQPIVASVLSSHIRLALRRICARRHERVLPFFGDVTIDNCLGRIGGPRGETDLTRKEAALLACLLETGKQPIARSELLSRVWGYTFDPGTSVFDVALSRLRRKVESISDRVRITSSRGLGFRLVDTLGQGGPSEDQWARSAS